MPENHNNSPNVLTSVGLAVFANTINNQSDNEKIVIDAEEEISLRTVRKETKNQKGS